VPLPSRVVMTPAWRNVANSANSSDASAAWMPPPATMTVVAAPASMSAAWRMRSRSGPSRSLTAGSSNGATVDSARVSGGTSTWVGRGRPERMATNASWIAPGRSSAFVMRSARFVTGRTRSSWSWTSWARLLPMPIADRLICPDSWRTGDDAAYAVASPAPALYTPGPGTISVVPGRPSTRAYPSAMYVVPCSCRVVMNRTSPASSWNESRMGISWIPGRPNTTSTPSRTSCSTKAVPPERGC